MTIKFYLQPTPLTPAPNDQSARVVSDESIDIEGIIPRVLKRGTLVTETDVRAVLTIFFDEVTDLVADGNTVLLPLVNIRPGIKGVFTNAADSFDSSRHSKKASLSPGVLLTKKMDEAKVEKLSGYHPSPELLEFTDINTQTINTLITPGGIGKITGSELKFNPANPLEGLFLVDSAGAATQVSIFATRTEGTLMFSIPSTLGIGSYTPEVRKGYGANASLRTGVLNEPVTVD